MFLFYCHHALLFLTCALSLLRFASPEASCPAKTNTLHWQFDFRNFPRAIVVFSDKTLRCWSISIAQSEIEVGNVALAVVLLWNTKFYVVSNVLVRICNLNKSDFSKLTIGNHIRRLMNYVHTFVRTVTINWVRRQNLSAGYIKIISHRPFHYPPPIHGIVFFITFSLSYTYKKKRTHAFDRTHFSLRFCLLNFYFVYFYLFHVLKSFPNIRTHTYTHRVHSHSIKFSSF